MRLDNPILFFVFLLMCMSSCVAAYYFILTGDLPTVLKVFGIVTNSISAFHLNKILTVYRKSLSDKFETKESL